MSKTLFSYEGPSIHELTEAYGRVVDVAFYEGDTRTAPATPRCPRAYFMRLEQAVEFPVSVLKITTNVSVHFRREKRHIGNKNDGVRVLWFVTRGSFKVTTSKSSRKIISSQFGIVDSSVPFVVEVQPDQEGKFESIQVIIPSVTFTSYLADVDRYDGVFIIDSSDRFLLLKILALLFDEGVESSPGVAAPLVNAFLETASSSVREHIRNTPKSMKLSDRRFHDIDIYIGSNISRWDLSHELVARTFGISSRYLAYILSDRGTTFSALLKHKRLDHARSWLNSPDLDHLSIQEIAFRAGFKSSAHFSRLFKQRFGYTATDFRSKGKRCRGGFIEC